MSPEVDAWLLAGHDPPYSAGFRSEDDLDDYPHASYRHAERTRGVSDWLADRLEHEGSSLLAHQVPMTSASTDIIMAVRTLYPNGQQLWASDEMDTLQEYDRPPERAVEYRPLVEHPVDDLEYFDWASQTESDLQGMNCSTPGKSPKDFAEKYNVPIFKIALARLRQIAALYKRVRATAPTGRSRIYELTGPGLRIFTGPRFVRVYGNGAILSHDWIMGLGWDTWFGEIDGLTVQVFSDKVAYLLFLFLNAELLTEQGPSSESTAHAIIHFMKASIAPSLSHPRNTMDNSRGLFGRIASSLRP